MKVNQYDEDCTPLTAALKEASKPLSMRSGAYEQDPIRVEYHAGRPHLNDAQSVQDSFTGSCIIGDNRSHFSGHNRNMATTHNVAEEHAEGWLADHRRKNFQKGGF